MTRLQRNSPCKINLVLNILGKRPDGFHELETVMHPLALCDQLAFEPAPAAGIQLTCDVPALPVDSTNLVHRAAAAFFSASGVQPAIRVHLEKRVPLAAGLGGGSSNAAVTLLALNELFGAPLKPAQLQEVAAGLGSDVPFFLQQQPALALGRGERVTPLDPFPALSGLAVLLIHPGFGVSTAWAYQALALHPTALQGRAGRAQEFISRLREGTFRDAAPLLFNSLESPVLEKYPVLRLYQEFLTRHGAMAALMSGSGSTTFAVFPNRADAERCIAPFREQFGDTGWMTVTAFA